MKMPEYLIKIIKLSVINRQFAISKGQNTNTRKLTYKPYFYDIYGNHSNHNFYDVKQEKYSEFNEK